MPFSRGTAALISDEWRRGHPARDEGVVLQHLGVGSVQPEQALEGGERAPGRLGEISIAHDDRAY